MYPSGLRFHAFFLPLASWKGILDDNSNKCFFAIRLHQKPKIDKKKTKRLSSLVS
jgi:hypothetical protein